MQQQQRRIYTPIVLTHMEPSSLLPVGPPIGTAVCAGLCLNTETQHGDKDPIRLEQLLESCSYDRGRYGRSWGALPRPA